MNFKTWRNMLKVAEIFQNDDTESHDDYKVTTRTAEQARG